MVSLSLKVEETHEINPIVIVFPLHCQTVRGRNRVYPKLCSSLAQLLGVEPPSCPVAERRGILWEQLITIDGQTGSHDGIILSELISPPVYFW